MTYLKKAELFVHVKQPLQPILMDMQVREVGQEIVPDEDGEHNKVVDNVLEIVVERQREFDVLKFDIEILAHEREVEQVKVDRLEAEKMDVSARQNSIAGGEVLRTSHSLLSSSTART